MTLNSVLRVALGSGIILTKFDLRQLLLLTLNFYSTSRVMCLNSVRNLSEIE